MSDPSFGARLSHLERWCLRCYIAVGLLTLMTGFFLVFVLGNRAHPLEYGGPVTIEDPITGTSTVTSGEIVNVCFERVVWRRLCESLLVTQMEIDGRVFDLPVHPITPPRYTGPLVEKKCRPMRMPVFGPELRGHATITGFARSMCWPTDLVWPLETPIPEARFEIK